MPFAMAVPSIFWAVMVDRVVEKSLVWMLLLLLLLPWTTTV